MSVCAAKFLVEGAAETAASGGVLGPVVAVGGAALAAAAAAAAVTGTAGTAAVTGTAATASVSAAATGAAASLVTAASGAAASGSAVLANAAAAMGASATGAAASSSAVATGTAGTVALGAGRVLLMGTGAIGIGITCIYAAYRLQQWNAATTKASAKLQSPSASGTPLRALPGVPSKPTVSGATPIASVPKLHEARTSEQCVSFPKGIRIAFGEREGTVASIERGLVAVEFENGDKQFLHVDELEVICNTPRVDSSKGQHPGGESDFL